jgi:hypothetical protein
MLKYGIFGTAHRFEAILCIEEVEDGLLTLHAKPIGKFQSLPR